MLKRKLLAVMAAAILSAGLFSVSASASSAASGTVCVGTSLNVRTAGNTGAPVIGKLYDGARVTILSTVKGWDQITYSGKTAWISGLYVITGKALTVVSAAKSQLGVSYSYGADSPYSAFDCSGLTMYAYGRIGVSLPHNSSAQSRYGWTVSRYALRPGDLLFFDPSGSGVISHCGIYIGNNLFISAQSGAGKVMEANLTTSYWSKAFVTARRLIS